MIGRRLGSYEISAQIGEGGMGRVYKAKDSQLGREVALKVLPEGLTQDAERLARFEREAKLLASLNHPNIAQIYGLETSGGSPALVMELVEGPTLADRLAQGSLPIDESLSIARQIAEALEEAHEKGIVHRDLKPQNVKASIEGKVKVLDFGLAKAMEPPGAASGGAAGGGAVNLTHSPTLTSPALGTLQGVILGTAAYMAPEQARGLGVDKRADLWALGVILFEMLSGRRLFEGELVTDVLAGVLKQEIDWSALPPETPPALRRLLRRCLERKPENRIRDAGDVRWELDEIARAADEGVAAPAAASEAEVIAGRAPGWRWLAAGALGLALGLGLAFALGWLGPRKVAARSVKSFVLPPEKTSFAFRPSIGGPVLSPDGTKLVFPASDPSGRTSLWVRPLDSTGARELTGTEEASYPFWSPDSRWVGFFVSGKLRKIDVTGGPPETVCDAPSGRGGSWSPEGVIVFAPQVFSGLQRVSAAGGSPIALSELDAERSQTSQRWPVFLPDGRHFLYWAGVPLNSAEDQGDGIFIGSIDGGKAEFLLPSDSDALYAPPGYLLFLREGLLMAQGFDASSRKLRGDAFPIAEQVASPQNYRLGDFSVSQEGTLVYQTGEAGLSQIVRLDAKGSVVGQVGEPASIDGFRLSPDGTRLAIQISDARSKNVDLWIADLARNVLTRFTFDPGLEISPVWSPDGTRIAYSSNSGTHNLDVYVKAASGAGEAKMAMKSDLTKYPSDWSSDGRYLAMTVIDPHGKTRSDIWIAPVGGGGEPSSFLATPFSESNAVFSPDGHWLAYQSDESGTVQVYLTPFPGPGGKWQVSQSGGRRPVWRRDGRALDFEGPDGTLYEAEVTEKGGAVEVGTPVERMKLSPFVTSGSSAAYELETGGRGVLAIRQVDNSSMPLTLVTNWTAGLRK
jgi:Tol biopolymer transport system component